MGGRADTRRLAVKVPGDANKVAREEFGASFMTPVVTRYECTEHLLKGILQHSRFFYTAVCAQIIALLWQMAGAYGGSQDDGKASSNDVCDFDPVPLAFTAC